VGGLTDDEIQSELSRLHREYDRLNAVIATLEGDVLESSLVACEECGEDPKECVCDPTDKPKIQ